MLGSGQLWFLQRKSEPLQWIIPAIVSGIMFMVSVLPWLKDPLGDAYSAWNLHVELGWFIPVVSDVFSSIFSYGVLCAICGVYAFLVAYANLKSFRGSKYFVNKHSTAALLCIVPCLLFCLQYLCIDMPSMSRLAQREVQLLLVQHHFGYKSSAQRISINPLTLDIASFQQRLVLLIDQVSFGLLGPCVGCWLLLDYRGWFAFRPRSAAKRPRRTWPLVLGLLALGMLFGRAPIAQVCEGQAQGALGTGNYVAALRWLDAARLFNPLLDNVAYYHRERGQALYFLHNNDEQNDDSRVYLAATYRNQGNLFDAYQQLLATWKLHHPVPWLTDELSITLAMIAESGKPLKTQARIPLNTEEASLQWLQTLIQVDPTNVYARYSAGRIDYEVHDYTDCAVQMSHVLKLSTNLEVRSSAYTYIGLGEAGQGHYVASRNLLLQAVRLDPYYRNNVAREELSGLR